VRFVGQTSQRESPSALLRFWLCLGVEVIVCPAQRPDLNAFVERYQRTYDEECLQVVRGADLERVRTLTAAREQHYNDQRADQGLACRNQPPRLALPDLPLRPPLPVTVDLDRSLEALDGHEYVRKLQHSTSVTVGTAR
jgi:Integrase core domain